MESQQFRTGKETLRTMAGVCGVIFIVAALIVYMQAADEITKQLCGAAALVSALITIRLFMSNPVKTTKNHEHN